MRNRQWSIFNGQPGIVNGQSSMVNCGWLSRWGLIVLFFIVISFNAFGQKISATLDRDKIIIGEQVTLQLKVTDVNAGTTFLANWFNLGDTINHITVIRKDTVDTVDVNGLATYMQHITITSFDSGKWAIPLQKITLQDRATGKQTIIKPDSVFLQVLPVDVSNLKDYHDIKDIIDVPEQVDYTLWIAGAISAVVVTVLIILMLRRKKRPAPMVKKAPKSTRPPLEEAMYNLKQLESENLPAKGQTKEYYIKLDEICRAYFEEKLNIHVMQLTSDEMVPAIGLYLQNKQANTAYRQLLALIDAAKFAKYTPAQQENAEALQLAAATLQHIDGQVQIATQNAK